MTVIKINALTVPAERGAVLAERFAARASSIQTEGFKGFELLEPTDDRTTWLVVTRWESEDAYEAWLNSESFARGHGQREGGPAATASELWSYRVAVTS